MIFDFKCNETGISCHQKEPKNFGPSLFGPKPVDPSSPKVQLFQTWFSPSKSDKIAKIRSLPVLNLKSFVIGSGVIFAIWARFEGEISIKNDRNFFWMLKFKLKVELSNKPSILVHVCMGSQSYFGAFF